MKAVCVLESVLRKKDDEHFSYVASYFTQNNDVVQKCSESPQASLREKAIKVPLNFFFLLIHFHILRTCQSIFCVNKLPLIAVMKKLVITRK
jgi:hypothetical protein